MSATVILRYFCQVLLLKQASIESIDVKGSHDYIVFQMEGPHLFWGLWGVAMPV